MLHLFGVAQALSLVKELLQMQEKELQEHSDLGCLKCVTLNSAQADLAPAGMSVCLTFSLRRWSGWYYVCKQHKHCMDNFKK